ncbi:MAG: YfiM family protein [Blastomonas fulva]|uniref:hypothetical protein n=1 Tax=Blastomonas fulva TaxID=1550728 RepID=UPI0024E1BBC4|nr:hypothetical protein [Blastomonas fulva]MDK2756853.1 YfiM family protein [Blastomonas fulva]
MTPPEPSPADSAKPARGPRRRGRWLLAALLAVLVTAALALLSLTPLVPEAATPDTASAAAARNALQQITGSDTRRGALVQITVTQRELDGLAGLASEALAPLRIRARLQPAALPGQSRGGEMVVDMSRELGAGLWVNAVALVRPTEDSKAAALPDLAVTIGRVPVPQWLSHWALARLWRQAQGDQAQGDQTRPVALEQALKRFTVTPDRARLVLVNPGRGAALAGLAQAGGTTPDPERLAAAYCAIAGTAGADLPKLVRLAAAQKPPAGISAEDHNRVLLTAIAMRAVPEYREKLAGSARALVADCGASADPVTLAGREDLAKHWALSAAISATLGSQVARSMGTWKELADSSEGGSGFSFVDLAADRSGERFAMAAVKPQLARTVQTRLVAITQDQMLSPELLTRPEGLDQAAFERDYTAVDSPEYAAAVRTIDRMLGNAGVP